MKISLSSLLYYMKKYKPFKVDFILYIIMSAKEKQVIITKATPEERRMLNMLRDIKLIEVKSEYTANSITHSKSKDRDAINTLRDDKLKELRKSLGIGRGRPKRAITQYNEKKNI